MNRHELTSKRRSGYEMDAAEFRTVGGIMAGWESWSRGVRSWPPVLWGSWARVGCRDVDFYTAVPADHGDGRGLPACLILHGASATAADYPRFGFGRFLTDAVRRGAAPFVLAGATGSPRGWEAMGGDDPMRMVYEELPRWCTERGFDASRRVAWGWSLGGYGVLRLAELHPGFVRAVAAFSPAVSPGDRVFGDVASLQGTGVGLWCGRDDGFYPNVRRLEQALPEPPRAGSYGPGHHTRAYWNRITPSAFDFLASTLTP